VITRGQHRHAICPALVGSQKPIQGYTRFLLLYRQRFPSSP